MRSTSSSEKIVEIINRLNNDNTLEKLAPITVESKELIQLNDAASLLKSNQIQFNEEAFEKAKKPIISDAIKTKTLKDYKTNSWILLSGPIDISNTNNKYINIKFVYFSGANSEVSFECDVPSSNFNATDLDPLLANKKGELNIFGKIINTKSGKSKKYIMNCFAIYR